MIVCSKTQIFRGTNSDTKHCDKIVANDRVDDIAHSERQPRIRVASITL
jgi:hypothetical protein